MNAAHVHLLLNHVPVLGAIFACLLLAYAVVRESDDVTRSGLWTLGLVGVAAVVVYLTGEPAEELIEGLGGVSEAALERHEAVALWATVVAGAVGALAFLTLFLYRERPLPRRFRIVMLLVALGLGVVMGWTAGLGGQVRHEEIRGGAAAPPERPAGDAAPGGAERPSGEAGGATADDDREAVVLPQKARATVLREMRQMLEALNGVLRSARSMDRAAMAEAARSGGTRIAVDTDPAVAERLPDEFVRLGSSTHEDFDALADAIEAGVGRDSLFARLGALTSKCVACHASYRVETGEDGR